MRRRREKQPLDAYSAGSTFKRPQGAYASALIRDAGLMGYHINQNAASSQDFLELIQQVKETVKAHSGYELECEIRFLKK